MATITGSQGRDVLYGTSGADTIYGLGGGDRLYGSQGSDVLNGGDGSDTVDYSRLPAWVSVDLARGWTGKEAGSDTLISIGNVAGSGFNDDLHGNGNQNLIQGGAGDDTLWGGGGDDTLDGGTGNDIVNYSGSLSGVSMDLATGVAADGWGDTDRIISVGHAIGSANADTLSGTNDVNQFDGAAGDDRLFGRAGNDVLIGGQGDDLLDGGDGSDRISYVNDPGGVAVDLAAGTATDGWGGHDAIVSVGLVSGTLFFADVLSGNDNANTLEAWGGANVLTGRGGADTFIIGNWDYWDGTTITDFQHGADTLQVDLRGIPIQGYAPGSLPAGHFTTGAVTGSDWIFSYDQSTGAVSLDLDGAGVETPVDVVTLGNHPTLSASDFVVGW